MVIAFTNGPAFPRRLWRSCVRSVIAPWRWTRMASVRMDICLIRQLSDDACRRPHAPQGIDERAALEVERPVHGRLVGAVVQRGDDLLQLFALDRAGSSAAFARRSAASQVLRQIIARYGERTLHHLPPRSRTSAVCTVVRGASHGNARFLYQFHCRRHRAQDLRGYPGALQTRSEKPAYSTGTATCCQATSTHPAAARPSARQNGTASDARLQAPCRAR